MIESIFNLSDNSVTIYADTDLRSPDEAFAVSFGFTSDNNVTEFSNLSFGFVYTVNGTEVQSAMYPENDEVYESTDQYLMAVAQLTVIPGSACSIDVWAENAGTKIEDSYSWQVPEFPSPSGIDDEPSE